MRVAVDFALRSETEGTFAWIQGQPAGALRDRILSETFSQLAAVPQQDEALRDWLDLFQSREARLEAERLLEGE